MRIVMLNADLPPSATSGVAYQVSRLANVMAEKGHEVVVRTLGIGSPSPAYEVRTIYAPKRLRDNKAWRLAALPVAYAMGRYRDFDLIHAHGDNPILHRTGVPVVRTFYGAAREEARSAETLRRKASQFLLVGSEAAGRRLATLTVGISQNTSNSLGGLDFVIPCGVDRKVFRPRSKSHRPSILYVGTLTGRKRGSVVIEAFKEIVQPRIPDAELWLCADRSVSGRGIKSFAKASDDLMAHLFGSAWVFTLPSTYEGFGVPYIEAMASGTPVVASPNPGALELVRPETGGVLAEERELGEVICALLTNREKRSELAARGREASTKFGWDVIAERYEEIYGIAIARLTPRTAS